MKNIRGHEIKDIFDPANRKEVMEGDIDYKQKLVETENKIRKIRDSSDDMRKSMRHSYYELAQIEDRLGRTLVSGRDDYLGMGSKSIGPNTYGLKSLNYNWDNMRHKNQL